MAASAAMADESSWLLNGGRIRGHDGRGLA